MALEAAAATDAPELVELNLACSMDREVTLGAATRANCAAMDSADQQSNRRLVLCCDPTDEPNIKESRFSMGCRGVDRKTCRFDITRKGEDKDGKIIMVRYLAFTGKRVQVSENSIPIPMLFLIKKWLGPWQTVSCYGSIVHPSYGLSVPTRIE